MLFHPANAALFCIISAHFISINRDQSKSSCQHLDICLSFKNRRKYFCWVQQLDYFLHFLQSKQTPKWRNWRKRKNAQILLGAWLPHRDRSKRQGVTPPARYIINPQVRHNYITGEEWGQIWEDSIPFEDLFLPWYCHCSCVWSYSLSELTFFLLISPFPNHIFPSSLATELLFLCSAGHRETPPPILHDMDSLKFQETAFMGISRI